MISEKSLVIYRNRPALVSSLEGEKINITVFGADWKPADSFKVREKDIELIHGGPCSAKDLEAPLPQGNAREVWELLADDTAANAGVSLKELAELAYGVFSPGTAWAAWELLRDGTYFTGDIHSLKARPQTLVEAEERKREEKQRETGDRALFLEKLKQLPPFSFETSSAVIEFSEADRRFLQDVEALARGRSDKSRTLKELGKGETAEEAHRLLLTSGAWTVWENPHPDRFSLSRDSAKIIPPAPAEEKRLDLTGMPAYAIDSPWSSDPDDAISLTGPDAEGSYCLWVHVADPAASIIPGSPADIEARDRGATLYLPEGASRMLAPEVLPLFALGLKDLSPALSFKIFLKPNLAIADIEIFPSLVRVTRLSYEKADTLIAEGGKDGEVLAALSALAERNTERRLDTGAVMIDLPEVHIEVSVGNNEESLVSEASVSENRVSVEPIGSYRSADIVRECMVLAGEGAARWALQRKLPFPFISQEAGELPEKRLTGFAGAWQLRRCMRPRSLSSKPAVHWGLGLDEYTQVTSPLRRYTDLICHQQIRAWLAREAGREQQPLGEDEILFRAGAAEAAASAVIRAEKASRAHWIAVYLSGKKDSLWDGVVLDRKGSRGTVIIPALGIETQLNLRGNENPNDKISLSFSSARIPEGEVFFSLI
jgi:exoribonuclease-2